MSRRIAVVLTMVSLSLVGGCSLREGICSSGEYPVAAVGSTTGRACVADGEEPPKGYVRFPDGKVPKHVGDDWDRYWDAHVLDAAGGEAPA